VRLYIPTLCDETAKDGAPVRFGLVGGRRFALCANAHLSDDKTVAKMGHPVVGWEAVWVEKRVSPLRSSQKARVASVEMTIPGGDSFWSGGLEAAEVEVVLDDEGEPEDGGGEEEGVDAVEDSAVAGEHGSGVLDAGSALDGGLEEIA